jgi:hypothetical protein
VCSIGGLILCASLAIGCVIQLFCSSPQPVELADVSSRSRQAVALSTPNEAQSPHATPGARTGHHQTLATAGQAAVQHDSEGHAGTTPGRQVVTTSDEASAMQSAINSWHCPAALAGTTMEQVQATAHIVPQEAKVQHDQQLEMVLYARAQDRRLAQQAAEVRMH